MQQTTSWLTLSYSKKSTLTGRQKYNGRLF